jgi:hypothetical protein
MDKDFGWNKEGENEERGGGLEGYKNVERRISAMERQRWYSYHSCIFRM